MVTELRNKPLCYCFSIETHNDNSLCVTVLIIAVIDAYFYIETHN